MAYTNNIIKQRIRVLQNTVNASSRIQALFTIVHSNEFTNVYCDSVLLSLQHYQHAFTFNRLLQTQCQVWLHDNQRVLLDRTLFTWDKS